MNDRSYYEILGVSKNASSEAIRQAYRKLARKYHPDVNKSKGAEDTFKQINEAYETLKDKEKKRQYDIYGKQWQHRANSTANGWSDEYGGRTGTDGFSRSFRFSSDGGFSEQMGGFNDFFTNMFNSGSEDFFSQARGHADRKGRSHRVDITISLRDAFYGASKTITLQSQNPVAQSQAKSETKTFQVTIPKGVTNGSIIRLPQQGAKGSGAGNNGDLLLKVHIQEDPHFTVKGHDLCTVVAVSPWEAALGGKIPVRTVDGSLSLALPAGSQSGKKFRLRGRGIPKRKGAPGDIIVEIQIVMPESLTGEEEKLFQELSAKSKFNPRLKQPQWKK